jgi:O-antigen ligase
MGLIAAYFVLAALASTAFAAYPKLAIRSFRTTVAEPVALFFLLTAFLRGRRSAALIPAIAVGGAIAAATAVFDPLMDRVITAGVPRLRGIYDSPNNLAFVLERTVPLLVGLAIAWKSSALGRMAAAVATGAGLILIATFSRGAWLASAAATALLAVPQWWQLSAPRRMVALSSVLIPVGALAGFVGTDRLSILFRTGDRSGVSRIWLWDSALEMIRDFPLFGVGPDNFLYHYAAYLRPEAWREPNMSHPHNFVLDGWLSTGAFGLLAIAVALILFFYLVGRSYRLPSVPISRPILLGAAASMTAALAHGLVDNFYFLPELAGFFWTLMAFGVLLTSKAIGQPSGDPALGDHVQGINDGRRSGEQ